MSQTVAADLEVCNQSPICSGRELIVSTSRQILSQLKEELQKLCDTNYTDTSDGTRSSIGGHTRHIIEFYQALFTHLQAPDLSPLSYDQRKRDMRIELSKDIALHELRLILKQFTSIPSGEQQLELASIVHPEAPMVTMPTTLSRELYYLMDHTVHHMAIIKLLAESLNIFLDKQFGLAQSTKAYEAKES